MRDAPIGENRFPIDNPMRIHERNEIVMPVGCAAPPELQQRRKALKPIRRPIIIPDESSRQSLLEKNKQLTVALLRSEAECKRDRDRYLATFACYSLRVPRGCMAVRALSRSNRMIHKLQVTVEKLAKDGTVAPTV